MPTWSARSRPASPRTIPRNPAVIADNVGDNVGDCAGMAADLFETYAVTAVAVMLLGVLTFDLEVSREVIMFPLIIGAVAILASIVGALSVRTSTGNVEGALYKGLIVSGLISAAAFYPITDWLMSDPLSLGVLDPASALAGASVTDLWLCALIGIGVTAGLFVITDYYTGDSLPSGQADRGGLGDGPRDQHHPRTRPGLAGHGAAGDRDRDRRSWERTSLPGIYGIGVAVMAQLSLTGLIVALDAFGPDHRQRRRHRRDGRHARGGAQRHRSARRGRQHDEGGHQGLRDRLGRAGGAGPVRRVPDRAGRGGSGRVRSASTSVDPRF